MSELLVSFCNRASGEPALVRVDTVTGASEPVTLAEPGLGVTGLVRSADAIYAVVRAQERTADEPERSDLALLDPQDFSSLLARWRIPGASDVHSLALQGGLLYAVSTGSDELLVLPTDRPGPGEVVWRPAGAGARIDGQHLNGLASIDGTLHVSGFGVKAPGADWKSASDGFLLTTDGETLLRGIKHPHTILAAVDTIFFCESPKRLVRSLDGRNSGELAGYTRGLCEADGLLWAGTSMGRRRSKSSGELNNLAAPGSLAVEGDCALIALDLVTLEPQRTISLAAYGREIYDLLLL